ncbi:MAG: asparagine synthase (glutamine-hydrolyzing) [Ectothiorhodospiraceae bacterium]|nr:asparagine synthase (glutamine-hydrolyzing) [Ectothiorhodospiraceae bacterium]
MCGIALIYHNDGRPALAETMRRMVKSIAHRGPDALTQVERGGVALGHARLSIVDVAGGGQPMLSDDGRLALVFNGEIYNYQALRKNLEKSGIQFRTHSDTEVLLRLYEREGIACVNQLRGMFAFAIHDRESGQIELARDRLGIKPLFYHWAGGTLLAGSEIKALFASNMLTPALDPTAIRGYFRYQFAISPQTPFVGVKELPPGYILTVDEGSEPSLQQYWDLEFPRDGEYESLDEAYWMSRFGDAFEDAASSHLIGDVPIGAYLSGGIDSAATTRLLAKYVNSAAAGGSTGTVQSYTIGFNSPVNDESCLAKDIADHLGVPNEMINVDEVSADALLTKLRQCIYHLEQPQRLAVDVPHFMLSEMVNNNRQKVVFTGDGADEIFGGYDCFRQDAMRTWGNQQKNSRQRKRFYLNEYRGDFAEAHVRYLFENHKAKHQRSVKRQFGCYPAWFDFWHTLDDVAEPLFTDELRGANNEPMAYAAEQMNKRIDGLHDLNKSLYIETKTRLPGWILWKSDRLSMAHSVETRVPFMDHYLVELAAKIPPGLKLNGMDEKYLLRKLMMPHLPEHPAAYKKRAFYTPIREWFFTPERQEALSPYLSASALEKSGLFQPKIVSDYLQAVNAQGQPQDLDQYYRVMKLEWALLLVLSVQMLHKLFVEREAECFHLE